MNILKNKPIKEKTHLNVKVSIFEMSFSFFDILLHDFTKYKYCVVVDDGEQEIIAEFSKEIDDILIKLDVFFEKVLLHSNQIYDVKARKFKYPKYKEELVEVAKEEVKDGIPQVDISKFKIEPIKEEVKIEEIISEIISEPISESVKEELKAKGFVSEPIVESFKEEVKAEEVISESKVETVTEEIKTEEIISESIVETVKALPKTSPDGTDIVKGNVDGLFYVDEKCIACEACISTAPDFFVMGENYVFCVF